MKRTLIAGLLILSVLVSLSCAALADSDDILIAPAPSDFGLYSDLAADWYREAADKYGYPEIFADGDLFHPNQAITRMEFARLLHKALGIEINYFAATDIADYFTDLDNADTGASALYDLVTAGIIEKTGPFRPDDPLLREDMIHYTINALNYVTNGDYALIQIMPEPFKDDASITEAYRNDVVKAVLFGLINGRGDNMLYPQEAATRAEGVVLVDRLIRVKKDLLTDVSITATALVKNGALNMRLVVENVGDETVKIDHTSGQKFDFQIFDTDGNNLYTWSADKSFIAALTTTEIAPGEKAAFTAELDSAAFEAIKDTASYVIAYITGTSEDFNIDSGGYKAEIA